jgi:hypothetical protein
LVDAEEGAESTKAAKKPRPKWWTGKFSHIKRKAQEYRAKKKKENSETKAATSMARATWWIVFLTFCLVIIAWFQYQEVQDSSDILDRMNRIYRTQAGQLTRQANETQTLADQTKNLASNMKDQASQTKILATQAAISNKILESVQRAYVNTVAYNMTERRKDNSLMIQVAGQWLNSGTTPAVNALARSHWYSSNVPITAGFDYPFSLSDPVAPFVLGPHGTSEFSSQEIPLEKFGPPEHLYFYGWVTYSDIFPDSERHLAEFCVELPRPNQPAPGQTSSMGFVIETCGEHSCYDRQCKDYKERIAEKPTKPMKPN